MSNTCTRATARPGSAIRRRAGPGRAPRSAAFPARSRARCCAAGTPTTAWRSAISRLGFVCTKQSVDGQDGLEGYYYEYDHPLELDARLVFARHLEAPLFDPAKAPALPVDSWPRPRLEKAYRNYAMEYVRTAAPVMVQLFGPEDGGYLLHLTGKLIGMQYFDEVGASAAVKAEAARRNLRRSCARCSSAGRCRRDQPSPKARSRSAQQSWKLMADVGRLSSGLRAGCWRVCSRASPPVAAGISPCACARRRAASRRSSGRSAS